ncbi:MAG: prephenate dehydrogenase [Chloroflexi bacterium]|nr:prephenate dehydrogenase [Chloroflexota bacterium]
MMKAQTITIVGLGRTGTSVGLAVQEKLDMTLVGYDEDDEVAQAALGVGAVHKTERNLAKAARQADILILTTAVSELEDNLRTIGSEVQEHTLILDFSNLKGPGLAWAQQYLQRGHYVGASPVLAARWLDDGRDTPEAAAADLFQNSVFCLMPTPDVDPDAVQTAVNVGLVMGARPYFIDPDEYDNLLQGTETLPGLIAAALFKTAQKSSAWADILRFAGQPFNLATQPLAHNEDITLMALNDKEATLHWLEALIEELADLRRLIAENDPEVVTAVLEELSIERDKWLLKREKNEWEDQSAPDTEQHSMLGQMFGGFAAGRRKKSD